LWTKCKLFGYNYVYDFVEELLKKVGFYHGFKRYIARSSGDDGLDIANVLTISKDDIDWPETTAFTVAGDGQIYFNLSGKYEAGAISPDEIDELRQELVDDLLAFRDSNGTPVIDKVYHGENIYDDQFSDTRPDLVCVPTPKYRITFPQTMKTKEVFEDPQKYAGHASTEQMDGIFYAWGDSVKRLSDVGMELADFAPTIHYLLDVPIPSSMDGDARRELFDTRNAPTVCSQQNLPTIVQSVRQTVDEIVD
jgi:predicted AlkP superfamily phosphohydrolase/phosphomutase